MLISELVLRRPEVAAVESISARDQASRNRPLNLHMKQKKANHIHDNPKIVSLACVERIEALPSRVRPPMPRATPTPQVRHEERRLKLMLKMIDYEFAQIKGSKTLRTPFGVLIWSPKRKTKAGE
jgi:hypothetical protein